MLTRPERVLLLLPLAGGAVFGLLPLLAPAQLAQLVGASGNDPYIYRLAGAATFGYAVALVLGLRDGRWSRVRLVVYAVLAFNALSLYAVTAELGRDPRPVVLAIGGTSVAIVAICLWLVSRRRESGDGPPDMATWVYVVTAAATVSAAVFGLAPLFPAQFAGLFGYLGTDEFLYRQAGAACFGYAVMGIGELRSRRWRECEVAAAMAVVFNGLAAIASAFELARGRPTLLVGVVLLAAGSFTALISVAIMRRGR